MATFEKAIPGLLRREGGYVNDPKDPGGETKYGITKRRYPREDIKALTPERAAELYRYDFWNPLRLGEIVNEDVAAKVLDMAVNMGEHTAANRLQRALNFILPGTPVTVDGLMGPDTIARVNAVPDQLVLLLALEAYAAHRYIELVEGPDPRFDRFAKGWLVRAMGEAL